MTRRSLQLAREVVGLVAREELVVEAVVALPLADAAVGPRVAGVRAVVVAARDEVVASVLAEALSSWPALLRSTGHGLGGDVAGREQEVGAERRWRRATSDSSMTSGYGGRPGDLLDPDDLRNAAERARRSSRPCGGRCTARSRRGTGPGGGCGVVKLYGPPVVSPKSDVPTALPRDERERRRRHRLPVRERLVVVGLAGLEVAELDLVVRRVARLVVGDVVQPVRVRAPAHLAVGRRRLHPPEAVVGARCSPCTR